MPCYAQLLILLDSLTGVLYSHRNEDVVNLRPPVINAQTRVKCTVQLENRPKKQETKVDPEKSPGKQNRNSRLSQKIRQPEGREPDKAKDPNTNGPTQSSTEVPGEDKRTYFSQLAKFKGTNISEFSKWYVSVSPEERAQLRVEHANSLVSNSS